MCFEIKVFCKSLPEREFLTLKDTVLKQLNEKSQSQKSTCYMIAFTCKLRTGVSIETELVSCQVGMGGVEATDS